MKKKAKGYARKVLTEHDVETFSRRRGLKRRAKAAVPAPVTRKVRLISPPFRVVEEERDWWEMRTDCTTP